MFSPGGDGEHQSMSTRAYRLKTKESPRDGMLRIAAGRAEKALERLGSADEETLAIAVHGARKDLKKLRGVLRLVRDGLDKKTFKAENRRYRDAGRLLSGSRDAEVKLETLLELRRRFTQLPTGPAAHWEGRLEEERDELAIALGDGAGGRIDEAIEAIESGREGIRRWSLEADSWSLLKPGLTQSYRDGREAMKGVLADPTTENVHEWRKRAKDLWYQLRIVADAWPELLGETVNQTHRLTDFLGDHHDLTVLAEDLRSRADLARRDAFAAAIEQRQGELLEAALEIGERLYAEKPKAFKRRIQRYWLAWREA